MFGPEAYADDARRMRRRNAKRLKQLQGEKAGFGLRVNDRTRVMTRSCTII